LTGPTYWQLAVAPWQHAGDLRDGWVAIASGIMSPLPALEFGFSRVIRFAGEGAPGVTPERLVRMLIMVQNRPMNWDDQKLELMLRARWRLLGRPMAGYAVIAQEDAPIWTDAGLIVGLHLPFIWSGGVLGVRYEYTAYGPRARWCPFCPDARGRGEHRVQGEWFDHTRQGEYLRDGVPAGDPLGGYGAGHTAKITFFPAAIPVRGSAWTFFQVREEGNLLFDRWPGKRRGGGVEVEWEVAPWLRLAGSAVSSHGPEFGWEHAASVSARATVGMPR
ncbi:MAG TPA: capsule assembly Wzi family protein, partial [Longimicrobiales bacterium]|nr:capsule assembly Wzi family protein [Longimicrobiales bacterium]